MKKYILLTALAAVALAGSAQETMYLIKGNQVVAKYNVADVDYAAFKLPEGVTDITGEGQVLSKTYISASPVYLGTLDGCGSFQIQFSTKDIMNENPPLDMMYLDMTTPLVTDIKDIQALMTVSGGRGYLYSRGSRQNRAVQVLSRRACIVGRSGGSCRFIDFPASRHACRERHLHIHHRRLVHREA